MYVRHFRHHFQEFPSNGYIMAWRTLVFIYLIASLFFPPLIALGVFLYLPRGQYKTSIRSELRQCGVFIFYSLCRLIARALYIRVVVLYYFFFFTRFNTRVHIAGTCSSGSDRYSGKYWVSCYL